MFARVFEQHRNVFERDNSACPTRRGRAHPIRYAGAMNADNLSDLGRSSKPANDRCGGFKLLSHRQTVAHIATFGKQFVAKQETAECSGLRYASPMMSEWLIAALESSGVSQSDLAKKLTAMLGKSIDRAAVNKMTKNARTIEAREMLAIAEITGAKLLPRPLSQLRERIATGSDSHGRGLMATERCFFRYIELD